MPIPHLPFLPQSYRRDLATQIPRSSRHFGLLPLRACYDSKPVTDRTFTCNHVQRGNGPSVCPGLFKRGEAWGDSKSGQMLEHAIENGRGGCYLRLTPEQYRALRRP